MLGSDEEDNEEDADGDDSAATRSRSRQDSLAPSIASTSNIDLTPESLLTKFPSLFSDNSRPQEPKILITTGLDSTLHHIAQTFEGIIPNSKYVRRSAHKYGHKYSVREITKFAENRGFSSLLVIREDNKKPIGVDIIDIPSKITFHFRTTKARQEMQGNRNANREPTEPGSAALLYSVALGPESDDEHETPFSWLEYGIFVVLGIAMLWAWNMFLAAAPYFQHRFQTDDWALRYFQSAILSVSTLTNLGGMTFLANKQHSASYPFRINSALYLNIVVFALLTLSSKVFLDATPTTYLAFLLTMVALTAWASGLMQNGAFAFASSFGRPEYMQAIMAGQGVAGVLPSLVQVISVLIAPPPEVVSEAETAEPEKGTAAFIYFLTAVGVSVVALFAFVPLIRRYNRMVEKRMAETMAASMTSFEEAERTARKVVSMTQLFRKLYWISGGVFLCFAVTMFFPVLTPKILSVTPPEDANALLQPAVFIPLGFFFWNLGDLIGRSIPLVISLRRRPTILFCFGVARLAFLPLYLLCNIHGRGAVINSDFFYLLLVQLPFGLTNGWLASDCMMAAGEWVDDNEREASGGFMGLCLVAGLSAGSLLSFTAAGI
ncbi:hypothetical protein NUW58_g4904 [Xylaria curta]|uniref:Uncharacterized protein n=1 Tax=Xylaria curta TaxID=42375 RepID=A0ACC1P4A3_9PEZI|nr:hypothetical protein NUW58_g4904 [Xylaria curta]